jgi:L-ascorbate metabolism protein UlaG (beta-lactamase superfamily)
MASRGTLPGAAPHPARVRARASPGGRGDKLAQSVHRGVRMRMVRFFAWLAVALLATSTAVASCPGPVASHAPLLWRAALAPNEVGVTFLGHSSFLIESAGGVTIVTDYNGFNRPRFTPDIVTMNNAHSTHYTDHPDAGIKHVLRGWDPAGGMAVHALSYQDVRVRNVPTNVRDFGGTRYNGNSIFIFELGDLCIAHLGHLHHVLTPEHVADIGQIDVLLVPVDGTWTMDQGGMLEVIDQLHAPVLIPMHYFGTRTLELFLSRLRDRYAVRLSETPSITLSRASLPARPEAVVLPGY